MFPDSLLTPSKRRGEDLRGKLLGLLPGHGTWVGFRVLREFIGGTPKMFMIKALRPKLFAYRGIYSFACARSRQGSCLAQNPVAQARIACDS